MTEAENMIVTACCARAAELWAAGNAGAAEGWFTAAHGIVATADDEYLDHDDEVPR